MAQDTTEDCPLPADAVEVARVLGAWGVKGWIRLQPHSKDPQALFSSRRWFLAEPSSARHRTAATGPGAGAPFLPSVLRVTDVRPHGAHVVAAVQEVADRDAAQALEGARVMVSRASFPSTQSDEYYWVDLIGLAVINRQGVLLGAVDSLFDTGANAVMRVRAVAPPQGATAVRERLVPFVAAHVDRVDLAGRQILVDWDADF